MDESPFYDRNKLYEEVWAEAVDKVGKAPKRPSLPPMKDPPRIYRQGGTEKQFNQAETPEEPQRLCPEVFREAERLVEAQYQGERRNISFAVVMEKRVPFRLREQTKRREPTKEEKAKTSYLRYVDEPTGWFTFQLTDHRSGFWRSQWRDTKTRRLEDYLNDTIAAMIMDAAHQIEWQAAVEQRNKEYENAEARRRRERFEQLKEVARERKLGVGSHGQSPWRVGESYAPPTCSPGLVFQADYRRSEEATLPRLASMARSHGHSTGGRRELCSPDLQ